MERDPAQPASTPPLVGALLVVLGIVGFFYGASFGPRARSSEASASSPSTAGSTSSTSLTGVIGLLVAGFASRSYSLWLGGLLGRACRSGAS